MRPWRDRGMHRSRVGDRFGSKAAVWTRRRPVCFTPKSGSLPAKSANPLGAVRRHSTKGRPKGILHIHDEPDWRGRAH
jgi:hypothetical protein